MAGFKDAVKGIIGAERVSSAKGQVMHRVCTAALAARGRRRIELCDGSVSLAGLVGQRGYHVFRGYYDLSYGTADGSGIIAHRLPVTALRDRRCEVELGVFGIRDGSYRRVASSSAWCWQQGSRLRWHPTLPGMVMFNDVDDGAGAYCCRVVDVAGSEVARHPMALYDVSHDGAWGLSLNYSRLQRLRPGYGYDVLPDLTSGDLAPSDDGLFKVDLATGETAMVHTLAELADVARVPTGHECYLNHVSIAPDDSSFMFFLIHAKPGTRGWGAALLLENVATGTLRVLEHEDRVSHYCWDGPGRLVVTCHRDDGSECYCTYDTAGGEKAVIPVGGLDVDGHPNVLRPGLFVTDSYPLSLSTQRVSTFSEGDPSIHVVARLYHDYRMRGEARCDLHPSVEWGGSHIAVDTTCKGGRRSVAVLKMGE